MYDNKHPHDAYFNFCDRITNMFVVNLEKKNLDIYEYLAYRCSNVSLCIKLILKLTISISVSIKVKFLQEKQKTKLKYKANIFVN